jgi:uncharacterized membrane protein
VVGFLIYSRRVSQGSGSEPSYITSTASTFSCLQMILLAQNRQEVRDQRQNERDRQVASRTLADAEFITRELASIRLGLADVATVAEVEKAFEKSFERAALKQARSEAEGTSVKPPKSSDKQGSSDALSQ